MISELLGSAARTKNFKINWSGPLLSSYVISSILGGQRTFFIPFTGKTLSNVKFDESFISAPIQVQEKIYLISKEGSLYILS